MAKNHHKKPKIETIKIPKLEYDFLLAQNQQLIKQNRDLQSYINGHSKNFVGIVNSLGNAILNKYSGVNCG